MSDIKNLKQVTENLSVLYVEDDRDVAQSVQAYLAKLFKEVVYVSSGKEALQFYEFQQYDMVICDIVMSEMDGFELSKKIKEINNEQTIMVISAHSEINIYLESLNLGLNGFVVKPIEYDLLNKQLQHCATRAISLKKDKDSEENFQDIIASLNTQNSEFQGLLEGIGKVAAISKTDIGGMITYVNEHFIKITGYEKEELIGQRHNILRHKDISKSFYEDMWNTIQEGEVWEGVVKNCRKDNEFYFIHNIIIPLRGIDGVNEIKEYISIGFLATKEEMDKRAFKKQVITNNMEFRKTYANFIDRVSGLENELSQCKQVEQRVSVDYQNLQKKYKTLLNQINFQEKEFKEKMQNHDRVVNNYKQNISDTTDAYQKTIMKVDHLNEQIAMLENKYDASLVRRDELKSKVNNQNKLIEQLKSNLKKEWENNKGNKEVVKVSRKKNRLFNYLI